MASSAIEEYLLELVEIVGDALDDPAAIDRAGHEVGWRLVKIHATGEDSLPISLELLREAVPADADTEPVRRVLALITSVAAGYAAADRERTFEQQETMKRALLRSKLQAERELELSEARFHEVFVSTPIGAAICDLGGKFVEVNPAFEETLGHSAHQLSSMTIHDLFHPEEAEYLTAAYAELAEGSSHRLRERRRLVRADGDQAWTFLAVSMLRDADGAPRHFVTLVEDISELHLLQERFQYQALHDVLTGLSNRQFFLTRLEAALVNLPQDAHLTLYHLSLDGFELINDGLGHEVGDKIVKAIARRLEQLTAGEDAMVARFGGTEFAILLVEGPETPAIPAFAALINQELSEPIYVGEHGIATSASIGVVRRLVADGNPSDMMWAADVALRRAEAAGTRQWALFDPDRAPQERTDAKLTAIMPGALELGEFEVLYRPHVSLADRRILGVEAQLSWEPEERGRLSHDQCLRLAERSGVTLSLRDWMLRSGWEWLGDWHRAGHRPQLVVALSPNQAQDPDLVATVRSVLTDGALDPKWMRLCMPMPAVMDESTDARDNVQVLTTMGVQTVLHDFRGCPQELYYLRELSVHAVQFADELVRLAHNHDPDSPEVQAVARLIPSLHECGVPIVIRGLETQEQADWWSSMGCEIGVGTLYGTPASSADVPRLLSRG